MWYSLVIKLGMLVATMGVVFWIGWSVPSTVTRPAHSGVQPDPDPKSSLASEIVRLPASASSIPPLGISPHQTGSVAGGRQERAKLDLNRANAQELEQLPGIGPVLAERIVDYRKAGKTFRTIDDLRDVKGIGKKKLEQIRALVMVTPTTSQPQKARKVT
jgi:competence protein ComEA